MEVTLKSSRWALVALLLVVAALPAKALSAPAPAAKPRPAATSGTTRPTAPRTTPAARPVAPAAGAQRLDGIAAVVNDEVVLQSDVEEQVYLFVMRNQLQPDSEMVDTLRKQVLDEMINEKLVVAEAKRQGVVASDVEVNREADKAIQEAKERMGAAGFQEGLAKENLTEERLRARYRDEFRRRLLTQRMVQKAIPQRQVPQVDAEAYFKAHPDKFPLAPGQLRLAVIQVPVTPDSATDALGRQRALDVRKRISAGEKFAKVAAEVSEDPGSAKSGGDLGFFTRGSLEPALEEVAFTLPLGTVSEPVHSPYGWHLVQPLERDTLKTVAGRDSVGPDSAVVAEVHARHILIRVETNDADRDRARALADRLRGEAAKGMDYGTLVRRYSKYPGHVGPDGDLGFLPLSSFPPPIRAGLDTLEVGQVSEALENQASFNVFKLLDRKPERPYQLDEIKDQLSDAVTQIRSKERYDEWIKGLRAKAIVEVRGFQP
jgi:peptidyl-prolyl cis-trans isomerase SurA